jgi:hypothetical protein
VSNEGASGITPSRLTRPWVGRSAAMPAAWAGSCSEPLVSLPRPTAAKVAATATAVPPEEPAGERVGSCGLRIHPPSELYGPP